MIRKWYFPLSKLKFSVIYRTLIKGRITPFVEVQSAYSIVPVDWIKRILDHGRAATQTNTWKYWNWLNKGRYGSVLSKQDFSIIIFFHKNLWGCSRGVMVKAMDCGIVVSEFVFQSRYYVHFRANTLGKGMNPLILPAMG